MIISKDFLEDFSEVKVFEDIFKQISKECESYGQKLKRDILSIDVLKAINVIGAPFGGQTPETIRSKEYLELPNRILDILNKISGDFAPKQMNLLVLLDDIQKSSETSFKILDALISKLPARILLITFFRRELHKEKIKEYEKKFSNLTEIFDRYEGQEGIYDLSNLDKNDTRRFVESKYGIKIKKSELDLLQKLSGGYPLHIIGGINAIIHDSKKFNEDTVKKYFKISVEEQTFELISTLPEEALEALKAASILWEYFSADEVACILEKKQIDVKKILGYFTQKVEKNERPFYEAEFKFLHEIYREEIRKLVESSKEADRYYKKAGECFDFVIQELEYTSSPLRYIISHFEAAKHFYNAKNYEKALDYNFKSGNLSLLMWNLAYAYSFYLKANECAEKINNFERMAGAVHQIGMVLQDKGKLDEALERYNEALAIQKKYNMERESAITFAAFGTLWRIKEEHEKAIENFDCALKIFAHYNNIRMCANVFIDKAKTFYLMRRFEDCFNNIAHGIAFALITYSMSIEFYLTKFSDVIRLIRQFIADGAWQDLAEGMPKIMEVFQKASLSNEINFFLSIKYYSEYQLNKDNNLIKKYRETTENIKDEGLVQLLGALVDNFP